MIASNTLLRDLLPFYEEIGSSVVLEEFFAKNQEPISYLKGVLNAMSELKSIESSQAYRNVALSHLIQVSDLKQII